jgi:D-amino-acid dehydrogenase
MATLVIGAGLLGLSTAQALIDRGESVTVLDAADAPGSGTSFANGGLLTPSMPEPWNGPGIVGHLLTSLFARDGAMKLRWSAVPSLLGWGVGFIRHCTREHYYRAALDNCRLARYSLDRTLEIASRLGLGFDFSDRGTLCVYADHRALSARLDLCERLRQAGINFRPVSVDELLQIEPALRSARERLVGGIWLPDDARGDAHTFCRELAAAIERQGGEVRFGERVDRLVIENGRIRGVIIDGVAHDAQQVVLATGAGSRELLKTIGMNLPVQPAKGYSITVAGIDTGLLPTVAVSDDATHTVFAALGDRLRIAGTAEFTGYDTTPTPSRIALLRRALSTVLPDIAAIISVNEISEWAGLRPLSNDGRPLIGPTSIDGLFLNTGHGALGWTLAMGSGELVADQVLGQTGDFDGAPFLPLRA